MRSFGEDVSTPLNIQLNIIIFLIILVFYFHYCIKILFAICFITKLTVFLKSVDPIVYLNTPSGFFFKCDI